MGDDKAKTFQEEFPDIASGVEVMIDDRFKEKSKGREDEVDWLIDAKLKQREFYKALKDAFPGWQQTWKTPEFQAFLQQVEEDSLSGYPNYVFIEDAFKRLDSEAAIRLFKIFFEGGRKGLTRSSGPAMTVGQARKALKDLATAKAKGEWTGREKEYGEKEAALWRIIDGDQG